MTSEAPARSRLGWWKWLLLPLAPILLPLYLPLLLVFLSVAVGCVVFVKPITDTISAHRLRRAMRAAGRAATWEDVEAELARGPGALLVELPEAGWIDTNIWWMNQTDIGELAREAGLLPAWFNGKDSYDDVERRMLDPAFERWCLTKFIDRSTGSARLVQTSHSGRACKRVQERINSLRAMHPTLQTVLAQTWMAHLADAAAAREARVAKRGCEK